MVMTLISNNNKLPLRGYAEKKEPEAKLALLDDFDGDPNGYPHGQVVESVLFSHSELKDADVQRMQNVAEPANLKELMEGDKKLPFLTAYRTAVQQNIGKFYLTTALNLHTILKEQPNVKVVSQSQGETPARQAKQIYDNIKDNPKAIRATALAIGLLPEASLKDVTQELLGQADEIAQSEFSQKAKHEYLKASKAVKDKGITYLVAAGNHGAFAHELNQLGVKPSPNAFRSILVNDHVTVVGANTAEGEISTINSPNSGAETYERGEDLAWKVGEGFDREGVDDGTSLATPIVAGKILEQLEENPDLTPFDIESQLKGLESYQVTDGQIKVSTKGRQLVGDGSLEPFILDKIGDGFVTDIYGAEAKQFAEATQDNTFFALPGEKDHEFQLISIRVNGNDKRELNVSTYFDEGNHVLRAELSDGTWDPKSVVEELHFDQKRQEQIEARGSSESAES